jgi:iduronate 2-sulfatase
MWCKHTNYEEAAHIPLLVIAPGVTAAASHTTQLVETVDIYPTLCELAGLPAPSGLDGRSFVATLRDPAAATKDHILHVFPRGERLGRAIRTDRYRLVEWKKPGAPADTAEFELYDYKKDPGENKNLAADQPEVVDQLRALLARHPEAKPQVKSGANANAKGKGKAKAKAE